MGHDSGALNKRLNTTQGFSEGHSLHGSEEFSGFFDTTLEEEGDHTTESSHLLLGNIVLSVAGKTRVHDLFDLRVSFEVFSDGLSASAGSVHSDLQGLKTSEGHVAVEWAWGTTDSLGGEEELVTEGKVVGDEDAHNDVGVATDVFSDGVDTDVSAQKERALEIRRGEGVVNNSDDTLALGEGGDSFDVADLEGGVGGGFDPEELSVGLNGFLDLLEVSHVDESVVNTVSFLTDLSHVSLGTTVDVVAGNNVVTGLGEGLDDAGSHSAATGEGQAVLSVLNSSQCNFEGFSGGMTATGIVEFSGRFTRELLSVGSGKIDGNGDTTGDGVGFLAGVDGLGTETSVLLDEVSVLVFFDEGLGIGVDATFRGDMVIDVFHF